MARATLPRPHVTANFALTWDGRISTRKGTPSDFSSPRDKHRLLEIRATADAVLASAKTISADRMTMGMPDPKLRAARLKRGQQAYPLRVLLTNSGRIDLSQPLFEKDFSPIVIFSTTKMSVRTRTALSKLADVWLHEGPAVSLPAMLATLREEYRVKRLVCEGGSQVFRSLLTADLVDELHVTFVPRIFGGKGAPTLTSVAGDYLPASVHLHLADMKTVEDECFLRYRVVRPK